MWQKKALIVSLYGFCDNVFKTTDGPFDVHEGDPVMSVGRWTIAHMSGTSQSKWSERELIICSSKEHQRLTPWEIH